ncbi:MAG: glutamate synthase (NADPH/NADH) large chain [Phenylobacterium sp.]|jgi:glutamate synthase (NADPH/NADH) large chain
MTLYHHDQVRDNCGFGLIANIDGDPSHKIVRTAITGLTNMQHRGGISADGKTGDGCGLLMQKPHHFFEGIAAENGWRLGRVYGVGTFFLSQDKRKAQLARDIIEKELIHQTLAPVGWRVVPTNPDVLGDIAKASLPQIEQIIVNARPGWSNIDLERRLYIARRKIEKQLTNDSDFYTCSLSNQVTIYKGLILPVDLPKFYLDLADIRMQTAICVFHQRFSTNTSPKWPLAQPFRYLAHNGEINTIKGNRQWATARESKFRSPLLPDLPEAAPFVTTKGSDSASMDNMLELLLAGGMDLFRAMRLIMPPAWQKSNQMDDDLRAFYEFNSMHMEPWDGPAGVVMSDGRHAACNLDKNGLRPARYVITKDRLVTLASEVGIWNYTPDEVVEKGRVGPGEMFAIDTFTGKIWHSAQIDDDLKHRLPYREFLQDNIKHLKPYEEYQTKLAEKPLFNNETQQVYQKLFGYSVEEIHQVIKVMAVDGQEALGSMGDDTPIAVLSDKQRSIYDYFRQQFAQVTNPPIDPLRESHVMSLATCVGREQNVFNETSGYAYRVIFDSPVLMHTDMKQLRALDQEHYGQGTLSLSFNPKIGLEQAIIDLCDNAVDLINHQNAVIVVLSDRHISPDKLMIPAALAVGAVQQRLIEQHLRCDSNIIVETATTRDAHQFAVLLGLGATAIYPFFAYEVITHLGRSEHISIPVKQAYINYRKGINKGLLKIMSKMGISTMASYRCSGLFEAVGIDSQVAALCLPNISSRIGGANFDDLQQDLVKLNKQAHQPHKIMSQGGLLKFVHGGEYHCFNPDVVTLLQQAVKSGDYKDYWRFAEQVNHRKNKCLRDLMALSTTQKPIELEAVEAKSSLFKRFDSAGMSIGALGPEAHESLAIAMNHLGGFSNSGEGGEDKSRFNSPRNSRIKQVASGRFGVTASYLMNADVIQIKMAQGAKPGEGGQLPGGKVQAHIAKLRYSTPGVTLISPPPHHDIYSIEDLAQLIFDLKQLNPKALVSVKLVSEQGVGTIAAGVAKAYADLITISGHDGGTGASPLTSVKYAGSPWELGLSEAHHALVANGLRHKIRLQVDGGLKTGLDVVKGAILGAESFGFGTGPMVALGCKFLRICHLNNCATGIATQNEELRKKYFKGLPELVINYFEFIAQETRDLLAMLGVKSINDLIGRTDLLTLLPGHTAKQQRLNLQSILQSSAVKAGPSLHCTSRNDPFDKGELNQQLVNDYQQSQTEQVTFSYTISNTDRSVGATLCGQLALEHGDDGISHQPLTVNFTGTAGQSFGVWNIKGINLNLIGDANDYVGKGMSGGCITVAPPKGVSFIACDSVIMGNTCLYGATGGELFAEGRAGERFGVRNSGATTVVEGIGDNGCEYMTGGTVVVLGSVGINFGAGMTGGMAYLYDGDGTLLSRLNEEFIDASPVEHPQVQLHLKSLIERHHDKTASAKAKALLDDFTYQVTKFVLIKPQQTSIESLVAAFPSVKISAINTDSTVPVKECS